MLEDAKKKSIKILGFYWALGRFGTVLIFEAADEKEAMGFAIGAGDAVATETLVAVPRKEAVKLL